MNTSEVEPRYIPERYVRIARIGLGMAAISNHGMEHSLCAMIVRRNRVISLGCNSPKTHSISKDTKKQQLHAEMQAVIRCPEKDLKGSVIVVVRHRPSGKPGLARPCSTCQGVLRRFGVRRVFYTVNSDDAICPILEELEL